VTKGQVSARLVNALPQTRVCECDRSAVLEGDHGVCCKCGHRAEPERRDPDDMRVLGLALAKILNRS
jgi:hypothetical protein